MEAVAKLKEGNHDQCLYACNNGGADTLMATVWGIPEIQENDKYTKYFITLRSGKPLQQIRGFFHADKIEWVK